MNAFVQSEVAKVAGESSDGLLKPHALVEYARNNPDSALHAEFEWEDAEAAELYRLQQARQIIRVCVTFLPERKRDVRAFISCPTDRMSGDGYRGIQDLMNSSNLRAQVVEEALKRVQGIRKSYDYLPELDGLFDRLDTLCAEYHELLGRKAEVA